ncbi:DUF541 domain-containing protein [Candidatus Poribacteria bacterium]|nr:DUF541 domain-containing protein [Candidatus Poribacteria bacterium]
MGRNTTARGASPGLRRLGTWAIRLLPFVAATALLVGCTEVNVPVDGLAEGIRVSGVGTVTVKPDIVYASIGVQTFNADAQVATADNNSRSDAVIGALKALGIDEKDLKTSAFSIVPVRDWSKPEAVVVGFQVNNTLTVTIRDLTLVGKALQASIDAGANNINSVAFTVDDPTAAKRDARTKAIQDAHDRAETMAKEAGVDLGKPTSIVETSYGGPPIYRTSADSKAGGEVVVPVQPGELELTVTVDVVYEID